jgi:outer membrane lipoprotein-sorting protein
MTTGKVTMRLLSTAIIAFTILFVTLSEATALDKPPSPELAKLLQKIDHAFDPDHKARTVTNYISISEAEMPMTKIKFKITSILKAPNKRKTITDIPKIMRDVQVFNGKTGWKYNSRMGFQAITGPALNFLKYSAITDNTMRLENKYAKIELDKQQTTINGMKCYKLTGYPPAEYQLKPQIIYVDTKHYFVRKVEIAAVTDMGEVSTTVLLSDYKKFAGMNMAGRARMEQLGMTIELKVLSFKVNQHIPDSEFEKPKASQATTTTP